MNIVGGISVLSSNLPEAARAPSLTLFLWVGALLLTTTLVGVALHTRLGADHPVVVNVNARIKAWWIMVAMTAVALLGGRNGVVLLFGSVSFFALREFITLTHTRRGDHRALLACFFIVLPLQYLFIWYDWYGLFTIFVPVYAFLFLPVLSCMGRDTTHFLARTTQIQWGLMVGVYAISHVPALLALKVPGFADRNILLVVFLILVVQSSDVLQYIWGKCLGPRGAGRPVAAARTVAGFVGGSASATALGAALWWITPFSPLGAAGMALVISLMGFAGCLVMSAIKRDRGVKDWGRVIEGHGGMLDRVDSVCFSAPVFFHLVRHFYMP